MIGVFDSGIGGLSVLRALRATLPNEQFTYFADAAHAPYGERNESFLARRSLDITSELVERHGAKLVVVACNTATAAAIHLLRDAHPNLPIVGIEPALKPAARVSRTGRIGVMATRATLASAKFDALRRALEDQAQFVLQPCDGLAYAIERNDHRKIESLFAQYWKELDERGPVDTLVLGCTHYPFAEDVLRELAGADVTIIEPGVAVARRVENLLPVRAAPDAACSIRFLSSGDVAPLEAFASRWL